ncbi:MAG: hypothetical protein ACYC3A_03095 [Halothiobacillus sp.]
MNHYGVTAIRWNNLKTEITDCLVHKIDHFGYLTEGVHFAYHEVASLIVAGHRVLALTLGASGKFDVLEPILIKPGQFEYLRSAPNNLIFDLPTF